MAKGGNKLLKLKSVLKKWNSFSKSNRHSNSSISSSADDNDNNDILVSSSHSSSLHAVYVGKSRRRYLVTADVIHHPLFKELVERSNEYDDYSINVACEVVLFEHLLWMLENNGDDDSQPDETMNELVEFYVC